jgi:small subunit ribosomal protein S20
LPSDPGATGGARGAVRGPVPRRWSHHETPRIPTGSASRPAQHHACWRRRRCVPAGPAALVTTDRTVKRFFVANIKSQIKRIKTNEKARKRNQSIKSSLKTAVRKSREAIEAGDKAKAEELTRAAARQLDKAVSKGVIHANQAANRKSALTKRVNKMGQ